jgi:hypothetical protein
MRKPWACNRSFHCLAPLDRLAATAVGAWRRVSSRLWYRIHLKVEGGIAQGTNVFERVHSMRPFYEHTAGVIVLCWLMMSCSPAALPCSPQTCTVGCCDTAGRCQTSTSTDACGSRGLACRRCELGSICSLGMCTVSQIPRSPPAERRASHARLRRMPCPPATASPAASGAIQASSTPTGCAFPGARAPPALLFKWRVPPPPTASAVRA